MKRLIYILFVCFGLTASSQNLILNGSFELNNSTVCYNAMDDNIEYNNTLSYSKSFGDDYTTVNFRLPCWACSPPYLWGGSRRRLGIIS